jgi:hypothetical protein
MSSESQPLPISVYRLLLFCYPPTFRDEFGEQMTQFFADQYRQVRAAAVNPQV